MAMVSNCDDFIFLIYERIVIYEISLTLLNVLTATYICYINSFYFSTNEMVFKANINILLSKIFYWDLKVKAWSLKKKQVNGYLIFLKNRYWWQYLSVWKYSCYHLIDKSGWKGWDMSYLMRYANFHYHYPN